MLTLQRQKEVFIPATPKTGGKQNTWFFGIVRRKYGARLLKTTKNGRKQKEEIHRSSNDGLRHFVSQYFGI